jgi:hypothetical protein
MVHPRFQLTEAPCVDFLTHPLRTLLPEPADISFCHVTSNKLCPAVMLATFVR